MIMFFQMFKIQCIYIAVWEAKLRNYVITNETYLQEKISWTPQPKVWICVIQTPTSDQPHDWLRKCTNNRLSRKQQNAEDKRTAAYPQKATNAKQTTQLTVELRIQSVTAECISKRVRGCYYVIT